MEWQFLLVQIWIEISHWLIWSVDLSGIYLVASHQLLNNLSLGHLFQYLRNLQFRRKVRVKCECQNIWSIQVDKSILSIGKPSSVVLKNGKNWLEEERPVYYRYWPCGPRYERNWRSRWSIRSTCGSRCDDPAAGWHRIRPSATTWCSSATSSTTRENNRSSNIDLQRECNHLTSQFWLDISHRWNWIGLPEALAIMTAREDCLYW